MSQVSKVGDHRENSRYLKRFRKLEAIQFPPFELVGDMMLVERIERKETKTDSGIILVSEDARYAKSARDIPFEIGIVLLTGPGDVDADGNRIEMDIKSGDIVEIPMNMSWYMTFGTMKGYEPLTIGKMRAAQALTVFKDFEGTMEVLNDTSI